jgi:hypothetical protein
MFDHILFLGDRLYALNLSVRGHVSMMLICNANGDALPPLYAFSGVKLLHDMLNGAPEGMTCHGMYENIIMIFRSRSYYIFVC